MTLDQILVTLGGLTLSVGVGWFFWFSEKKAVRISSGSGVQEVLIIVKGGYSPDLIIVEAEKPVRLNFRREETASCSEQVLFPDLGKQATLPPFETIQIELPPQKPGEHAFQCGMGMLRGKLVVE